MDGDDAKPAAHAHHVPDRGVAQRFAAFIGGHKVYALAAVIYLIIALVNFWPVTAHLASSVAGTGGDVYQSLWDIWFVGYSLFTLHQGIWQTMLLFWPIGANLVYQTSMPIASLLVTPLTAVSLPFAFNVIFFAGFCLSGLAMFMLARYLTKNSYAAFIAGIIFTFSTFHIAQAYGHLEYTNIEWVPLALYFFIRHGQGGPRQALEGARHLGLRGARLLHAGHRGGHRPDTALRDHIRPLPAPEGEEEEGTQLRLPRALLVFLVATFILGSWAWIPIIGSVMHSGLGSLNILSDTGHYALWSDDLLSFFIPGPYNGLLGGLFCRAAPTYITGTSPRPRPISPTRPSCSS